MRMFFACLLLSPLTSCCLLYNSSYEGPGFIVYSDHPQEFVESVGKKIARISHDYQSVFSLSSSETEGLTVILKGNGTNDKESTTRLGAYLPFLELIILDTDVAFVREEPRLSQVLLHEVAHHFLITDCSSLSDRPWLNEGMAGVLEVTQFKDWTFAYPLFNPLLWEVAHQKGIGKDVLKSVIAADWSEFYNSDHKDRDYSIAWSICYYLLRYHFDQKMSLGMRIKATYALTTPEILTLEEAWRTWMEHFNYERYFEDLLLADDTDPLIREWARCERIRIELNKIEAERAKQNAVGSTKQPIQ